MRTVPPDVAAALAAAGIAGPATAPWVRCPDVHAAPGFHSIAFVCQCEFVQVFVTPVVLKGREVFVGQCPACNAVLWAPWAGKVPQPYVNPRRRA